ncbi:carbohydrate kinase family protein [Naumannella sp. ID2617S]|nr:carbohydrate kinase family protein [Naumannella sp. ID2617S]
MRVLVAGHLCIDLFVELNDQPGLEAGHLYDVGAMTPRLGGAVATTGEALRTLGLDVAAAATVGDDHLAVVLTQLLEQAGMDTSQLSRTHLPSSYSIVAQPPGRDRTFWHCTGANDAFTGAELDLDGIDLLHVGYPSLLPGLLADGGEALTALLTRAREQGIVTSVDLAVDQLALPGVRPTREFVPTVPARRIVTTTGAGDIATAGLLHGLCTGAEVREAAEGAVRVAARHVAGDPLN